MNPIINALVGPVVGLISKRSDRKAALDNVKAKTAMAKQDSESTIAMSKAEWELVSKKVEGDSWKDEFITVVVFLPFISMFVGSLLAPFGITEVFDGSIQMVQALATLDVAYGPLMYIVACAAIGIRMMKS